MHALSFFFRLRGLMWRTDFCTRMIWIGWMSTDLFITKTGKIKSVYIRVIRVPKMARQPKVVTGLLNLRFIGGLL